MAKGQYTLANGYGAPTQYDNSFRSCICTMLTLIALTVVILFFLWPWKYQQGPFDSRDRGEFRSQPTAVQAPFAFTPDSTKSTPTETSNEILFTTETKKATKLTPTETQNATKFTPTETPNATMFTPTEVPTTSVFTSTETNANMFTLNATPFNSTETSNAMLFTTETKNATKVTPTEMPNTTKFTPNATIFTPTEVPTASVFTSTETNTNMFTLNATSFTPNATMFTSTEVLTASMYTSTETNAKMFTLNAIQFTPNAITFTPTETSNATTFTPTELPTASVFTSTETNADVLTTKRTLNATPFTPTETSNATKFTQTETPNIKVFAQTGTLNSTMYTATATVFSTTETNAYMFTPNATAFTSTETPNATKFIPTETPNDNLLTPNTITFTPTEIPNVTTFTIIEQTNETVFTANVTMFVPTETPNATLFTPSITPNKTELTLTEKPNGSVLTSTGTSNVIMFTPTKILNETMLTSHTTFSTLAKAVNKTVFISTGTPEATVFTPTETSITTVFAPNEISNTIVFKPTETVFTQTETPKTNVFTPTTTANKTGVSSEKPAVSMFPHNETTNEATNATLSVQTETSETTVPSSNTALITTTETLNTSVFIITKIQDTTVFPVSHATADTVLLHTTIIPEKEDSCNSVECKQTESHMLSLIDHSADACDDFYTYACGGLQASKTLLEEDPTSDIMSRVTKQLKSVTEYGPAYQRFKEFYESCTSYDHTAEKERKRQAKEIFKKVGSIITDGNILITTENITDLLVKLFSSGSAPLFDIKLDVSATDATNLAIVLTKPRLYSSFFQTSADNLKHCRNSSEDSINEDLKVVYNSYVSCKNANPVYLGKTEKALEAFEENDIQKLRFGVETRILKLLTFLPSEMKIREAIINKEFKECTVKQLQEKYRDINWSKLFTELFERNVTEDTRVQLYFEEFFDKMFEFFKYEHLKDIHNALLAVYAHNLYTDLVLTNSPCERERYCFEVAENLMPEIVSNIYLTSFTDHEHKQMLTEAKNIFKRLQSTMKNFVNDKSSQWLDGYSQDSVIQKIQNMTLEMPQYKFSDLDIKMKNITLNSTQYLLNAVTLTTMRIKQYFSMYGLNPRNPDVLWLLFAKSFSHDVTYIHNINTLAVPLTRLVPLKNNIPEYIKMAKTGLIIGQGIGSAFTTIVKNTKRLYHLHIGRNNFVVIAYIQMGLTFDITGQRHNSILSEHLLHDLSTYKSTIYYCDLPYSVDRTFNEDGKTYNLKQEESLTKHSRQYDIIGINVILETIGDSFKTKLPWGSFSPKENFFLLLAQEYCSKKKVPETFVAFYEDDILPPIFRLKNMLANSEEFVSTFKCPTGSDMNNLYKCPPFPKYEEEF